jgi:hypothetical protein
VTDFRVQQSCRFLAIAVTIALFLAGLPMLSGLEPATQGPAFTLDICYPLVGVNYSSWVPVVALAAGAPTGRRPRQSGRVREVGTRPALDAVQAPDPSSQIPVKASLFIFL